MSKENLLIVNAVGRQLDLLRAEASRVAKSSKVDWWIERVQGGSRFCFENAKAKNEFALICDNFGVPSRSS